MHKQPTMDDEISEYCWSIKLNKKFPKRPEAFKTPRYYKFYVQCKKNNVQPFIDGFSPINAHQQYGVPIGGIGCGTIGRTFTGDFCRYQLTPGIYEYDTVEANMFTVSIRRKARTVYQQALITRRSKLPGLKQWNTSYNGEFATYHALYPESWTVYDLPGQNVKLTCHQISPVIPHNYDDSSLPTAIFNWSINNMNDEDIEVSIMFTWQCGSATSRFVLSEVSSEPFELNEYNNTASGIVLNQKFRDKQMAFCVAGHKTNKNNITYCGQFNANDEKSGSALWLDLLNDGELDNNRFEKNSKKSDGNDKTVVAVCIKALVKAKSSESSQFSLVWDMPEVSFRDVNNVYYRYYTKFFQAKEQRSQKIACYSFSQYKNWKKSIDEWRKPILTDSKLPEFYKRALFNELYFISDGGTIWLDVANDPKAPDYVRENGRFGYLEGHEYRMYNTYDVHFYASFALLLLWPKLQLSLQYDYACVIPTELNISRQYLYDGSYNKIKTQDTVPHDMGDPEDEPYLMINAYCSHDTKDWKDLNLKFMLQVYRDYYYLKDMSYLKSMWPFVKKLMITSQNQDYDNDGLIDSLGQPDQTYDVWPVTGASAYCSGLHVSALRCVTEMAKILQDDDAHTIYSKAYERAKLAYNEKLWNGTYYNFDCGSHGRHDTIMADMCCGHWYLRSSGFKHEVFEQEKIRSCLRKIYDFNIMKYGDGKLGAVNGMRPDGSVDLSNFESEEVWIGVTNSLASLMVYENMDDEAWVTIDGLYNLLYNQLGLAFQTPEALKTDKFYRSVGYMRALAIWSIQYALNSRQNQNHE